VNESTFLCSDCGANWSLGEFSRECIQCGGGALQRNCKLCNGKCKSNYNRAVIDSWDTGEAHWIGSCQLSADEKQKYMKAWLKDNK
jgi:hypothetical protein